MDTNKPIEEAMSYINTQLRSIFQVVEIPEMSNLIEKGLHSIQIMKIVSRLRGFGFKITFSDLMQNPTLRGWEHCIRRAKFKEIISKTSINKENCKKFQLTDIQYAYWVGRGEEQILGGVGCHAYFEIDGENINPQRLNEAWNLLQNENPMLRARFNPDGTQEIMENPFSKSIGVYNFTAADLNIENALLDLRDKLSHRKLRVEEGEVASLNLALLPNKKTRIFLDIDLLVADIMSISIIINDLARIYGGDYKSKCTNYTFKDFIEQREIDENLIEEDRNYWKNKIEKDFPIEAPNIPLNQKPDFIKKVRFTRREKLINKVCWNTIKKISSQYKVTPSMVLLSCYAIVIERWTNQESFLINIPLFNRNTENENVKSMVADFTNLLLLKYKRKANESILDIIKKVSNTFLSDMAHSLYSGVQVQRDLYKKIGKVNIAPIVFACNIDYPLETSISRLKLGKITYMISQTPGVWLDFQMYIRDDALVLCWDVVEELYPKQLIDDMFEALCELIAFLADSEDWNVVPDVLPKWQKEIREKELSSILPLEFSNKTLYDGFIKNVKKYPSNDAIIDVKTQKKFTYKEVYLRAMQIASKLVEIGVMQGDCVAITLPRGYQQIFAILGILFAGATYVPIGINQPSKRRKAIYEQIGINFIITDSHTTENLKLDTDKKILLKIDDFNISNAMNNPIKIDGNLSSYIIMTSGTTGMPKGVEISHQSAVNTIESVNKKLSINAKDSIIMVSAIEFDLSVYDIFSILSSGGKIITLSEENHKDPQLWIEIIEKYNVTLWNSVPILFEMLIAMAEGKDKVIPLKKVILSGDWIAIDLASRFYHLSKESIAVAMGGATEASIWSNFIEIPKEIPNHWISIPYGQPLKHQIYRVVDALGRVCPNYVKGQLLIGGVGVAKGYRGDRELTNQKFIIKDKIRWYQTGDNGRIWNDGTIEFLGRDDCQVKIKGHRIELGEIEHYLNKIDGIKSAKVIYKDKVLIGFVVFKKDWEYEADAIKEILKQNLLEASIPENIVALDAMPLNNNGKIDNKVLLSFENTYSCFKEPLEGEIQKDIAKIWERVLKSEKSIVNDMDFFHNGGDSLKAVEVILSLNKNYKDIGFEIKDIFLNPTIKKLSKYVADKIKEMDFIDKGVI